MFLFGGPGGYDQAARLNTQLVQVAVVDVVDAAAVVVAAAAAAAAAAVAVFQT